MCVLADARVRGWFLLDSYLPTFVLTAAYLLSIWLGNKYMRNRKALSLRGILTLYNLGITLLSAYMLAEVRVLSPRRGPTATDFGKRLNQVPAHAELSPHCSGRRNLSQQVMACLPKALGSAWLT